VRGYGAVPPRLHRRGRSWKAQGKVKLYEPGAGLCGSDDDGQGPVAVDHSAADATHGTTGQAGHRRDEDHNARLPSCATRYPARRDPHGLATGTSLDEDPGAPVIIAPRHRGPNWRVMSSRLTKLCPTERGLAHKKNRSHTPWVTKYAPRPARRAKGTGQCHNSGTPVLGGALRQDSTWLPLRSGRSIR